MSLFGHLRISCYRYEQRVFAKSLNATRSSLRPLWQLELQERCTCSTSYPNAARGLSPDDKLNSKFCIKGLLRVAISGKQSGSIWISIQVHVSLLKKFWVSFTFDGHWQYQGKLHRDCCFRATAKISLISTLAVCVHHPQSHPHTPSPTTEKTGFMAS